MKLTTQGNDLSKCSLRVPSVLFLSLFLLFKTTSANAINCYADDKVTVLGNMNSQVLGFLKNTANQFTARALVQGTVVTRYPDETGHTHFSIDLNGDGIGDLEVISQIDFGEPAEIVPGMSVTACGDYITDNTSPNGGIIHWVHCNPGDRDQGVHPDGFMIVNGSLYGYSAPAGQPACSMPH